MAFPARTYSNSHLVYRDRPTACEAASTIAPTARFARRRGRAPRARVRTLRVRNGKRCWRSSARSFRFGRSFFLGAGAAEDVHHGVVALVASILEQLFAVIER